MVKKTPKNKKKFHCKLCDFFTSNKKDFTRHEMTRKHKMVTKKPLNSQKSDVLLIFKCNFCNKVYKHRSGLSRHLKKCIFSSETAVDLLPFSEKQQKKGNKKTPKLKIENYVKKVQEKSPKNYNEKLLDEKDELIMQLKRDVEIAKLQREAVIANYENKLLKKDCQYKDDIIDIYKTNKGGDIYKNNTFNNNNTISINVFLNENCKNAMNLTDFVDQIDVRLEDVLYQKVHGCTLGLTNILTKQLKYIDPLVRPIHCSDEKKLHFYIKEDDKWSIDDNEQEMEKSLRKIQVKQIEAMKEWEEDHPNFENSDKLLEERNKLMAEILHGCENTGEMKKNVKEIQKNVAKLLSIQEIMDKSK
jgi:hypothetical protein